MFGLGDTKKAFDDMCEAVRDRSTFIANEFRAQADKANDTLADANETLHKAKEAIEDTARDIKSKAKMLAILEGVKTGAAIICTGLIGFIAYKVSDN